MTCAEAIRAYLLTLTPVTNLVNTRIWTMKFPQSPTLPAILVQQISDVHRPHLRGTDGLKMSRVQVDVIAASAADAREVDQAIEGDYVAGVPTGLKGFAGEVAGSPPVSIRFAIPDSYREDYAADELKQVRVMRDYRVWYEN